jgi:hypothetical protein
MSRSIILVNNNCQLLTVKKDVAYLGEFLAAHFGRAAALGLLFMSLHFVARRACGSKELFFRGAGRHE